MITREQVADLQPGDVVEITWPEDDAVGVTRTIRGPVHRRGSGCLYLGSMTVVGPSGEPWGADIRTLTVVSRAPRPLYVNHPRTEPAPGDVVRDADNDDDSQVWCYDGFIARRGDDDVWWPSGVTEMTKTRAELPARLRLLVDGETGQVVPQ